MAIDLAQWRVLVTVAERGSLVKAAETPRSDQPALSRSLRRPERLIGAPLCAAAEVVVADRTVVADVTDPRDVADLPLHSPDEAETPDIHRTAADLRIHRVGEGPVSHQHGSASLQRADPLPGRRSDVPARNIRSGR